MRKNAKKKLLAVALIGTLLCSTALSNIAIAADDGTGANNNAVPASLELKMKDLGNTLLNEEQVSVAYAKRDDQGNVVEGNSTMQFSTLLGAKYNPDSNKYEEFKHEDIFVYILYADKTGLAFRYPLESSIVLPSGETATHFEVIYTGKNDYPDDYTGWGNAAEQRVCSYTPQADVGDFGPGMGGDIAFRFVNVSGNGENETCTTLSMEGISADLVKADGTTFQQGVSTEKQASIRNTDEIVFAKAFTIGDTDSDFMAIKGEINKKIKLTFTKTRYDVNITAGDGLEITSDNEAQVVKIGTAIQTITVKVNEDYLLPTDYLNELTNELALKGLTVTETQTGFEITGTPTDDVNIKLPDAAKKKANAKYDVFAGSTILKPYGYDPTNEEITKAVSLVEQGTDFKAPDNLKYTVSVKGDLPAPSVDGKAQDITVLVTYDDQSVDEGVITIDYYKATERFDPKVTADVTKAYGQKATEDDIKKVIEIAEVATNLEGTAKIDAAHVSYSVDVTTIPEPSVDGTETKAAVTVKYADGSTDTTEVVIKYGKAADVYEPQPKDITVNKDEKANAEDGIANKDTFPTGTSYAWKNGDVDTSKAGAVKGTVVVTYPDQSTDEVEVTVTVVETTTPTDPTESTDPTDPTDPTNPAEPETNPTTEPTTEAETKPVATSSNATKNGSKSSGSKKPSASTNGSVGPADNTNTNTTEPTANTNEAIAPANNANTDVTESIVNAAMKGMLPKTGDMMNLSLTMVGLIGSLTGLVGFAASKKRKKS